MTLQVPDAVKPVVDFSVQIVIGAIAFFVVFLVAVGLSVSIHHIAEATSSPAWLMATAEGAERVLFGLDLFTFGLFLLAETIKLVRGIWKEMRRG